MLHFKNIFKNSLLSYLFKIYSNFFKMFKKKKSSQATEMDTKFYYHGLSKISRNSGQQEPNHKKFLAEGISGDLISLLIIWEKLKQNIW